MSESEKTLAQNVLRQIVGLYIWQQCGGGDMRENLEYRIVHWAEEVMRQVRIVLSERPEEDAFERVEELICVMETAGLSCGGRHVGTERMEE